MGVKKKRSKTTGDAAANSPSRRQAAGAEVVEPDAFLDGLEEACQAFAGAKGGNPPGAVGWVLIDDWPAHRERLGFRGLIRLEQAVQERIFAGLEPRDLATVFSGSMMSVLLAPNSGHRDFEQWAADSVRAVSGGLFEWDDEAVAATVSIGICPFDSDLREGDQVLLEAARLAETITRQGGNLGRIYRPAAVHADDQARALVKNLLAALKTNTLKVVYQPLIAVGQERRDCYQMLPRLTGPDGELIAAAEFVPYARTRGVLPGLDRWMLGRALHELAGRSGKQADFDVFLIQSAALIDDPKFLAWLMKQLKPKPELAERLVLEFSITELQARLKAARAVLAELNQQGLGICIGGVEETTPEELILEHVPADYLRMAPDFAKRVLARQEVASRYEHFARRARDAGRRIIIPMLEDAESVARIWQMDVDLIQGNFIQEPSEKPGD